MVSPDENSAPEAFAGHPEACVSPYYKAFARELGGALTSPGAKAIKIKDILKGRFGRTRMGQMFRLTSSQFDMVLRDAGAAVEWRDLIEETAGGKFAVPDWCTSSGGLERAAVGRSQVANEARGDLTVARENTVSDALGRRQIERVVVPKAVFQSVTVSDVSNVRLNGPQITLLSRAFVLWVWSKTGKFSVGAPLCRHAATQFEARHEMGIDALSKSRDLRWMGILLRQSRLMGRPDVEVRACKVLPQPPPWSLICLCPVAALHSHQDRSTAC